MKRNSDTAKNNLINKINERSEAFCCACLTFNELKQLNKNEFIKIMKDNFPLICDYPLEKSRIESWKDEYEEITNIMIPQFEDFDSDFLDYYIIFEYQMPLDLKEPLLDEYVYADAIILHRDGFAVLEFKQKTADCAYLCYKTALKYVHRLRYQYAARKQKYKYSYLVCTKESANGLWCFKGVKNFSYGNTLNVSEDLITRFLVGSYPIEDITDWLESDFKRKRR